MPKKKQFVLIGGKQVPAEEVVVRIPLTELVKLVNMECDATKKEVIGVVKPHVLGAVGRQRLMAIEEPMYYEEEVEESEMEVVVADHEPEPTCFADFSGIIQTIRRKK